MDDMLMRCAYNKNEGNYRLMWCAPRASRPPIQHKVVDDEMIGCYHYESKGDDESMWHAPRASQCLI
eukprot:11257698-Ditylum_brightwellii.AAC.1